MYVHLIWCSIFSFLFHLFTSSQVFSVSFVVLNPCFLSYFKMKIAGDRIKIHWILIDCCTVALPSRSMSFLVFQFLLKLQQNQSDPYSCKRIDWQKKPQMNEILYFLYQIVGQFPLLQHCFHWPYMGFVLASKRCSVLSREPSSVQLGALIVKP